MFREAGTDTGLLQYIPTKDVYSYGKEGNQYKTVQEYVEIARKNKNAILNNAQQAKLDNLGKNIQKDIAYN